MSPHANLKTTSKRQNYQKRHKPDEIDTLPPHSIEAEQGVLGCILSDPSCLYRAQQRIRDAMFFYDLRHQDIWNAFAAMANNGGIDAITLHEYLTRSSKLSSVGGVAYIAELPDKAPSVAQLPVYLDIVVEKWKRRTVMQICSEVIQRSRDYVGDISDFEFSVASDFANAVSIFDQSAGEKVLKPSDLENFDTKNDSQNLLGNRWLCRAGKCLIVGPSGRGKSTLNMQMAICWAVGRDFLGIKTVRPLKQVLIGDENDHGDLAEMFQGVCAGLGITPMDDEYALLEKNLIFLTCPSLCGMRFIEWIENWIERNPVDMAWLDPLVSFADVDLSTQQGAASFLRQGLSRIASQYGTCWMVIHHSPKPRDPKYTKGLLAADHQYAGAGSYDLAGWARATMTLRETRDRTFCLALSKRGERSGATHPDGTSTKVLWLRHSETGIFWEQVEAPEEAADDGRHKGGKPSKVDQIKGMNKASFLAQCSDLGEGKNEISKRLCAWLASTADPPVDARLSTCKRVIEELVSNRELVKKNDLYYKGPNA